MVSSRCWAVSAVLTLALVCPGLRAGSPQCPRQKPDPGPNKSSLIRKTYSIADLVTGTNKEATDAADKIIETIVKAVRSKSWTEQGGCGTIEFRAKTRTLVVRQTASAHKQIKSVLKVLTSVQEEFTSVQSEKNGMSPEEERLKQFWHDYYHAMKEYYCALDGLDWAVYYKNHGYEINGSGQGGSGRINYAPVFVSPNVHYGPPPMPMPGRPPFIVGGPFPVPPPCPRISVGGPYPPMAPPAEVCPRMPVMCQPPQ